MKLLLCYSDNRHVNYEREVGGSSKSLQWPVAADGTDEPLLYAKRFAFPDGKARLFAVSWVGPTDQPDAKFDLYLNNGVGFLNISTRAI